MTESGYDAHATARWVAEPPKHARNPGRGPFERDRARVLHSAALRRLAAKTQVVEVGSGDFPRTRLTHSLECAQIGREFGAVLGCDPDLVDAACLAHDLGHPPFGHNGESALADYAAACGGFEGNAQSLRLLTRLEAKVPGAGLNLTRATLDATLKYPWPARAGEALSHPGGAQHVPGQCPPGGRPRTPMAQSPMAQSPMAQSPMAQTPMARNAPKYGVYSDDAEVFGWIRRGAPPGRLCLEAQVMDWSDDVAYSVHDLEDGLQAGLTTLSALSDASERAAVASLTAAEYCAPGSATVDELCEIFAELLTLPCWPAGFDGGLESLAALKNLTSELIGRFCRSAQDATLAASPPGAGPPGGPGGLTMYAADLVVPRRQRLECALLKGVTARYVMSRAGAAASQAAERELIAELAGAVESGAPATLDPVFRPAWEAAGTDTGRRRAVVDQIASLTDTSARAWHRRLCR